ncbi:hypothetical protein [Tepidiforma sp.]|uniref:hypothetical protein n=1 Tax=Tepidiforma sp. TaxID=2682230 RepID=UPI002ADE64F9|nr:hypothetical protein [Tepidiforma sp.]
MTDVIALLAISQLVSLGALFYLSLQVQQLRRAVRLPRRASVVHEPPAAEAPARAAAGRAARNAYAATPRPALEQLRAGGPVDIAELARRMQRSEEEVRLLLRRQGIAS